MRFIGLSRIRSAISCNRINAEPGQSDQLCVSAAASPAHASGLHAFLVYLLVLNGCCLSGATRTPQLAPRS